MANYLNYNSSECDHKRSGRVYTACTSKRCRVCRCGKEVFWDPKCLMHHLGLPDYNLATSEKLLSRYLISHLLYRAENVIN